MTPSPLERFYEAADRAVKDGVCIKLTLGKYRGPDASLKNVFIRPIQLKAGPRLSFVHRHATRDETHNLAPDEALAELRRLVPAPFRDAHLFTPLQTFQFSGDDVGGGKLRVIAAKEAPRAASPGHDRAKQRLVPDDAPWLRDLGITSAPGVVKAQMVGKFRQINRFVELLAPLIDDLHAQVGERPLTVTDMGCGKGYLTFAIATVFSDKTVVAGVERRSELVSASNEIAARCRVGNLSFVAGEIASDTSRKCDLLIALHACDTATDEALAKGIEAGAGGLVVSPCCQKELRPQLTPAAVLAPALVHGIFQERQAEFVTDALRALLLEWAGYRTRVMEFISTEHTAKNLLITALRGGDVHTEKAAEAVRNFARFYGIRHHALASRLGFVL
ncbi:class I SAM-dependent methyltransferase [Nibricoccus sp. IMCC34717]|uniref:class I SAM-dependent methyltransferase n=1 Tax=Nibricoccus sp. IMCC34717 TaxID=3034021 RepID=UPI00385088FD